MRKAVALAIAALLAVTLLVASNMAFKLGVLFPGPVPRAASPTGFTSGTSTLSLPFNQQVDLITASDLFDDIDGGSGNVEQIQRYVSADDTVEFYTGIAGTDFPLTPGEGYMVQVNTDTAYIVVGTHDPTLAVHFSGPQPDPSPDGQSSGTNLYANPFHSVASTADELRNEIGLGVVTSIGRWVSSVDGIEVYSGFAGQTDFPLVPGRSYFVVVNTDVSFVPAHY